MKTIVVVAPKRIRKKILKSNPPTTEGRNVVIDCSKKRLDTISNLYEVASKTTDRGDDACFIVIDLDLSLIHYLTAYIKEFVIILPDGENRWKKAINRIYATLPKEIKQSLSPEYYGQKPIEDYFESFLHARGAQGYLIFTDALSKGNILKTIEEIYDIYRFYLED